MSSNTQSSGSGKLGITLPSINQPYADLPGMAAMVDEAGFDSVWNYEVHRNPFTIGALCAATTKNVALGTGLAAAAGRSPMEMANAAADVDELSGGRAILGFSVGAIGYADALHGADVTRPLPKMREYIKCVRAGWKYFETGEQIEEGGEFFKFHSPAINPWGLREMIRPEIPIYLGALKPLMMKLAGSSTDGAVGYLMSARFAREVWVPGVDAGANEAGRDPNEVDKVLEVLVSVDDDREKALAVARVNVGLYVAHPISEEMVEYEGLMEDRAAVLQTIMTEGPAALANVTSDALVKTFSITGTPDEAREQLVDFQSSVPHVALHIPYMPPINREESKNAFLNAVQHLGRK